MAYLTVTPKKYNGFSSSVPTEIEESNIVYAVAEVINDTTKLMLKNDRGARLNELIVDESFTSIETSLAALDNIHTRVSVTDIDGSQELPRTTPFLIQDKLIERIIGEDQGSILHYNFTQGADAMRMTVLESPAAIAAGNASTTGS